MAEIPPHRDTDPRLRTWEATKKHWVIGTVITLVGTVGTLAGVAAALTGPIFNTDHLTSTNVVAEPISPPSANPSTKVRPDGWGPDRPEFTREHPPRFAVLDSINNSTATGEEHLFTRVRQANTNNTFMPTTEADVGSIVEINVDVENDCADDLAGPAATIHNLWMRWIPQPITHGREISFQIFLGGNNAMTVYDGATVLADQDAHLQIVPGSAKMTTWTQHSFTLDADALARGDNVPLGQDRPDGEYPVGKIPDQPDHSYGSGYVTFQAKVVAGLN